MNYSKYTKPLLAASIALFLCNNAYADFPYDNTWWVNAGLASGVSAISDKSIDYNNFSLEGGHLSLNFPTTPNQLFSISANSTGTFSLFSSNDTIENIDVLYGLMAKGDYGYASISSGISYVHVQDSVDSNTPCTSGSNCQYDIFGNGTVQYDHSYNTVGLPAQIQLFWTPFQYVGVGIVGIGNYNSRAPYAAALVALQFGNLRFS